MTSAPRGRTSDRMPPTGRRSLRCAGAVLALAAVVSAGVLTGSAVPAAAATSTPSWAGIGAVLPPSVAPGTFSALFATSCAAPGNCVAVGASAVSSGGEGLVDTLSGGSWTGVQAPIPAGSSTPPAIDPVSVSCPSVGSCVSVGIFRDSGSHAQGLLLTQAGGSWTAGAAPLPADASPTDPSVFLLSVSCGSPGSCAAAGYYVDASGHDQGLLETLAGGSWAATEAPLPADASPTDHHVTLYDVSCAAASCVSVGSYRDGAGHTQGVVDSLTGGAWSAAAVPLPADAAADPTMTPVSVSCPAAGTCMIAGFSLSTASHTRGILVQLSGGVLTTAESPAPADAAIGGSPASAATALESVACPTVTYCVATGGYASTATTGSGIAPLIDTLSSGTWSAAAGPGSFDPAATTLLQSVSCSWPGSCVALGTSTTSSTASAGVLETLSGGTWTESSTILPSDASQPVQVHLGVAGPDAPVGRAVSCVAGSCVVAGSYSTTAGTGGFLDTYPNLTGYQMVATDGGIFAFGAPFLGSMGGTHLNQPIVGMAAVPDTGGYYEVASDGGIFAFGAPFQGSMGGQHLNAPVVGIAFDSQTGGYYEVASDGGIFAFNAPFLGSMGGQHLNKPIVGIAFDSTTGGYYEVASDGGIFAFGAPFQGSMGGQHLNKPIVGIAFDATTGGYYEVATDGGLFAFGAPFLGSMGGQHLNRPIVGMAYDSATGGYYEVASDGGIFAFGAPFLGSMGGAPLNQPVVGIVSG